MYSLMDMFSSSSSNVWRISDMEMEDHHSMMHQFYDTFDEFGIGLSPTSYSSYPYQNLDSIPNINQLTMNTFSKHQLENSHYGPKLSTTRRTVKKKDKIFSSTTTTTTSNIISFGQLESSHPSPEIPNDILRITGDKAKRASDSWGREPSQAREHMIAERKRREKINKHFIALSTLVPGLTKTDKVSVLGDAVKYMKQLQERVKALEEEKTIKKSVVGSSSNVKKSGRLNDDKSFFSSDESFNSQSSDEQSLQQPEIEARISDKDVLIRVHSDNNGKLLLMNMMKEIEKLQLCVISSSTLPFGNSAIDMTVVAKMDNGYFMTVEELVRKLRQALPYFMC